MMQERFQEVPKALHREGYAIKNWAQHSVKNL